MKKTKSINVKEVSFPDFSAGEKDIKDVSADYTHLLMDVPLDVRVEIGKTRLRMCEILSLAQGSIIRLEKQAGAPVDVIANNQTVARGDVIVIDENFGVRITEILSPHKFMDSVPKQENPENEQSAVPVETVNEERPEPNEFYEKPVEQEENAE